MRQGEEQENREEESLTLAMAIAVSAMYTLVASSGKVSYFISRPIKSPPGRNSMTMYRFTSS